MNGLLRRPPHHEDGSDRGITLVDMLIACALLVIALPLAGLVLETAVVSERDVRGVNDAGTAAQTVVASVEAGVRNAAALRYTRSGTGGLDELLVTRTLQGPTDGGTWVCAGWFYDATADVLYTRTVPTPATAPAISAPTATTLPAWTQLAVDVTPRPVPLGTPVEQSGVFRPAGQSSVDLELSVATGTPRPAVTISTTVARRPQGDVKGTPCF